MGVCLAHPIASGAQDGGADLIRFDFETGDLQGWQVIEGAFDQLICDRATFHNTGKPYNKQGKHYLSTLEKQDYRPSDAFTGVVESPVFVLGGPEMSLLVGGGEHRDTYVALCTAQDEEVLHARGKNTETMQRVQWTAPPELIGQSVFLRVVDANTGGWGHVTLDDFTARGKIDPGATRENFALTKTVLQDVRNAGMPPQGTPETLRAAVRDLMDTFGDNYPGGGEYLQALGEIEARLDSADRRTRLDARAAFTDLHRRALLANPLVSAQPILYVVRPQYRPDHHNTATLFQTGEINAGSFRGGGALKAIDLRQGGPPTTLVDVPGGIIRDPDVHFSGARAVFSMRRDAGDDYHIYEVCADGTGPKQLTSAPGVSDIDPIYAADDAVVFSSTREPKYCMCNRHIMANLFRMQGDGANIYQIGKSTLFEGHACLLPDGRILYDRWEYVDRNFGDAQGLWVCGPDGTNHALYWGNNTASPGAVLDARAIGDTGQAVCTFSSCHDRPWGALAIIDRRLAVDGKAGVVRTWPADSRRLVDQGNYDTFMQVYPKYEDPYPLGGPGTDAPAGKYFLCARMVGTGETMGIFLLDVFGNEVPVHVEEPGCYDPMPLTDRRRPGVVPARRDFGDPFGYLYVMDVYQGTHMQGVKRGAVKYLRVVESPEKRSWTSPSWGGQGQEAPAMAWHDFNNKRILGTVPVQEDGSAYFRVPSERFVYFQLLDENKMMVQSMRSGTVVQPGEHTGCVGCHESRHMSAPAAGRGPGAARRAPHRLEGWNGAPRLFSYMAEVQPVLDKSCASCHDYGKPAGKKLNLAADRTLTFNTSYNELWRKKYVTAIGAGPHPVQQAYSWGSHASKLVEALRRGHGGLQPGSPGFERIVTWVDINAPYYPTYASAYPSNLAGRSPLSNKDLSRLTQLTGVPFLGLAGHGANKGPQISFDRPEMSPCLTAIEDVRGEAYREALQIIQAGRRGLAATPRADMPGFEACSTDQDRQAKYEARAAVAQAGRATIREGSKAYDVPAETGP